MLNRISLMKKFSVLVESLKVAWYQAREAFAEGGWKGVIRPRFFWRRKATPVEMDLSIAAPLPPRFLKDSGYCFVEIKLDDLQAGKWSFSTVSRGIKASRNIKKGWRGFALVLKNQVVGDVWCAAPRRDGTPISHSDLGMLGITCAATDAYAFDMYIAPDHRGENLAVPFHRFLHAALKNEGCRRIYGFYWDDNLPALWMHRIMKFKELKKRRVTRVWFYTKAEDVAGPGIGVNRASGGRGQPPGPKKSEVLDPTRDYAKETK